MSSKAEAVHSKTSQHQSPHCKTRQCKQDATWKYTKKNGPKPTLLCANTYTELYGTVVSLQFAHWWINISAVRLERVFLPLGWSRESSGAALRMAQKDDTKRERHWLCGDGHHVRIWGGAQNGQNKRLRAPPYMPTQLLHLGLAGLGRASKVSTLHPLMTLRKIH